MYKNALFYLLIVLVSIAIIPPAICGSRRVTFKDEAKMLEVPTQYDYTIPLNVEYFPQFSKFIEPRVKLFRFRARAEKVPREIVEGYLEGIDTLLPHAVDTVHYLTTLGLSKRQAQALVYHTLDTELSKLISLRDVYVHYERQLEIVQADPIFQTVISQKKQEIQADPTFSKLSPEEQQNILMSAIRKEIEQRVMALTIQAIQQSNAPALQGAYEKLIELQHITPQGAFNRVETGPLKELLLQEDLFPQELTTVEDFTKFLEELRDTVDNITEDREEGFVNDRELFGAFLNLQKKYKSFYEFYRQLKEKDSHLLERILDKASLTDADIVRQTILEPIADLVRAIPKKKK